MAQKKKGSAARTATANVPLPPFQEETVPARSTSSASPEGDSRRAVVASESHAGSGTEVPLSENIGGAQWRRDVPGKGDVAGEAPWIDAARPGAPNGIGKVVTITGPGGSAVASAGKDETAHSALIRGECEKALVALRRGNSTKALRLIKVACSRNGASGVAYRVQGHIFMRLASVIEDANTKQRHFVSALESAKKAASLSTQSVEYAHFYAQLLFEAAKDNEGYGEVVRECERALFIEDPVDPARESLHNEQQQELPTAEARIAHVHQELKALVQKANISSISTWMKTLGTGGGEENLRFVQMRKFADQDLMEQRVSQPKRPHEVKKVVKTPQERRKEIEVRVAAAKLLQQRDTLAESAADTPDDHEKSLQKKLGRRKSRGPNSRRLSKPLSKHERIDRVLQFWHALTQENRETKLVVSIAQMKDHLTSWKEAGGLVKSHAASDALSEALDFAQEKKTWRFWACCKCGERYISYQDLSQHTWEEHIRSLPEKLQQVVPQEINQEWVDQLLDEDFRPIDGAAAVRMLIESARSFIPDELQVVDPVTNDADHLHPSQKNENEDIVAMSVDDANQKMIEKNLSLEDIEAGSGQAASGVDQGHLLMCKGDCHNGMKVGKEIPSQDLPSADDEVRRKLLEKIYGLFRILIRSKYLAQDHVAKIILYAIEEIRNLVPDPEVHHEFNQSPLYIRFLDPQPLQQIQKYLMELAQGCGVSSQSDSPLPSVGEETGEEEIIQDRLFLNEDFTQLLLDERVIKEFPEEVRSPSGTLEHAGVEEIVAEKGLAAHRPPLPLMKGKDGEPTPKHVDLQLSWIYGTTEYEFLPSGWKQFREEQGQRGRDAYRALEREFQRLHALCEQKYELVSYEEALNLVERLCVEENRRREHQNDGTGKRFETVLKGRQQELLDLRIRGLPSAQKVELDAISNVLRDAQFGMVRRPPYDGSLGVRVSDSDEDEEAWRKQESLSRADTRVEAVIMRQREQLSKEVNHLDATIMKATDDLQKMEIKLGQLAVLDYRAVVLPLVKSLLQKRLEGEAEKDAMQKSDAAQEAFLAELAKDQKSSGCKESENLKQAREKSKEKKKAKEHKKFKDVKRGPSNSEQLGEAASVETDEVDDADNWDWAVEDEIRQQRESEIREEERKLLEALESQRRVEEEAKQRYLSEQGRKKQIAQQITEPLEDWKVSCTLSNASTTVDVVSPIILSTKFMQLALVENEVAGSWNDQASLPLVQTNGSLLAHNEHSDLDKISVDSPRFGECTVILSEQEMVKDACQNTSKEVGKDALLLGDDDHLNTVQKKTRGGGNRHRRRRGPRMYAEEGISADQDAQPWKTPEIASGSRSQLQQNDSNGNGRLSTTDKPRPLLRQNAAKSFGAAPANGVPAVQPLLSLPSFPSLEGAGGHEGKKTLWQLQAEQDYEERFQADLEQAMRQSLNMLTLQPSTSIATSSAASSPSNTVSSNGASCDERVQQMVETGIVGSLTGTVETPLKGVEEVGKGLRNEVGQYNCFLNVVIQSLWHLRRFREELLADSSMQHVHVGNPCVVCALRDIFLGLDTPTHNSSSSRDAVAPTALRVALSAMYSDSDFFQEAQMNDASEVLAVIFECLHKAFVPNSSSDGDSESSTAGGSWDCQGPRPCMAHALFGLDVAEQMNCQYCGLESRHLKYTTFFHNINASALRTAKVLYQDRSMDELLKIVGMNHQLACDTETGGCGRQNHIHHLLHAAPTVITTVLGWQNGRESFEDISATVDAMDVSLNVGAIYRGFDEGFQHRLISVVCYYGQHYHCFAYNQELDTWVMFDDSTVKVIGEWRDVASTCRRGHLQPQVLFYEAVAARSEALTSSLC
ncbi:hypothetical protein KC19_VG044000 [Ceratodon purpureus]|uniref:USP domain-containing protein n=1 Tax=Ceratodon purpureus TaxID=3225 RepID=A0A8T0HM67_CERPU|nr:hypothetical protein KC19_VG044000 [Ceratodon purpureus]